LEEFAPFGLPHLLVIIASALLLAALVGSGRRAIRRGPGAERALRIAWAIGVIALQGATQVRANLPGRFDATQSLPLHICDLVPWVGVFALLGAGRRTAALSYFWGLGLSGWAFILPVLTHGAAHIEFWFFWLGHVQIIGTALYLVLVLGFRPGRADLAIAMIATVAYSAAILPIDIALGADYGYLGEESVSGRLGPWPARVPLLVLGELAIFALLAIPGRRKGTGAAPPSTG